MHSTGIVAARKAPWQTMKDKPFALADPIHEAG
jgi:hypothetical protein